MRTMKFRFAFLSALGLLVSAPAFAALTVTNPPATTTTIAAGDDFATQVVGNAWDMDSTTDFDVGESTGLNAQSIASGLYSATVASTTVGGSFMALPMGWGSKTIPHWIGEMYPVDTSHYTDFTIKLRDSGGTGKEPTRLVFFRDGDSPGDGSFGSTHFKTIAQDGSWAIESFDLLTETYGPANHLHLWTDYPLMHGLRFDFAVDPNTTGKALGPDVQVEWMRMTTPSPYSVTWTDSPIATYNVTAIDSDGIRFQFNSAAIAGTSYSADFALLAPGDYHIEVKNLSKGTTATSGKVHINSPPKIVFSAPTVRGEQSKSYALAAFGHQWGPLGAGDFSSIGDFSSYSFPAPGYFYGRPDGGDTRLYFNVSANKPIDTNLYRSVCVSFEIFGPRDITVGSVARLFYSLGNVPMSVSEPFVPYNNTDVNEYCFEDLKNVALDPSSPANPWTGVMDHFRFDPHEFPFVSSCNTPETCHDVQLNSLFLSPFAAANPVYTIAWTLSDADGGAAGVGGSVELFLNTARTTDMSQAIPIATLPYRPGAAQYNFVTRKDIANGKYYVGILANDGLNSVLKYADGPLVLDNSDIVFSDGFDP